MYWILFFAVFWILFCVVIGGVRWLREFGNWISQGLNLFVCIVGATADEAVSSRIGKYKRIWGGRVPFGWSWPEPFLCLVYHVLSRVPFLRGHFIRAIEDDEGVKA